MYRFWLITGDENRRMIIDESHDINYLLSLLPRFNKTVAAVLDTMDNVLYHYNHATHQIVARDIQPIF